MSPSEKLPESGSALGKALLVLEAITTRERAPSLAELADELPPCAADNSSRLALAC